MAGERILFASYALRGHINPCIVLAAELAARGHAVFFATQHEGREWLSHPGIRHVPWEPRPGFVERLRSLRGAISEEAGAYRRLALSWDAAAADYAVAFDSLDAALQSVNPDVLIVPQFLSAGIDLAHERKVPLIVQAMYLVPAVRRRPAARVAAVRAHWKSIPGYLLQWRARRRLHRVRRSRTLSPALGESFRWATVVATSDPSIEGGTRFGPNIHMVGPMVPDPLPPLSEATQRWLARQGPGGVVFVALGTLVRPGERLVSALAEGLADCGAGVLWALPERHHDVVRRHSASFRTEAFVPQTTILSCAAIRAFVTHAGANSAVESMYWGRPMLALPFMFDQHHYAQRAVDLSVGLALDPHRMTSADVRDGIRRLLREPTFADAAVRLAARLQRAPGVKGAADIVEAELRRKEHARPSTPGRA